MDAKAPAMESWPTVTSANADSLPIGSFVHDKKQPAIIAADRIDSPFLVVRSDSGFKIGATNLKSVEALAFNGATVLDLMGNDFSVPFERGRPSKDNEGSIFVTETGPMLAVATEDESRYLLLDPSNGQIQELPNHSMSILKHWRLGVRVNEGAVCYLFKSN